MVVVEETKTPVVRAGKGRAKKVMEDKISETYLAKRRGKREGGREQRAQRSGGPGNPLQSLRDRGPSERVRKGYQTTAQGTELKQYLEIDNRSQVAGQRRRTNGSSFSTP